ncbi:MAG: rRNA maturation RNase YbeY [Corallococcus sp.]|nr:rRNA maturation RNase YbeY [Bacillota bacterium]MCM1533892.1 rRNA maturation RNase YbeY [Corallococcus sp.]
MMKIYFTNAGFIKYAVKRVLNYAVKYLGQPSGKLEMSVSIVSQEEIRNLNREFRNVDSVTDVLSFPTVNNPERKILNYGEFASDSVNPATRRLNIGDVVICSDRAKEQAQNYGHSLKREICFLALHGTLHLLGYDHIEESDEQQMTSLQERILTKLGIVR